MDTSISCRAQIAHSQSERPGDFREQAYPPKQVANDRGHKGMHDEHQNCHRDAEEPQATVIVAPADLASFHQSLKRPDCGEEHREAERSAPP